MLSLCIVACGGGASADGLGAEGAGADGLSGAEVLSALEGLPFEHQLTKVRPPKGAETAFRGIARGSKGETVHFAITVGDNPVALPVDGAGTVHAVLNGTSGFTYNDDSAIGKRFRTTAQWHQAMHMATTIEERLCRKATNEPCAV